MKQTDKLAVQRKEAAALLSIGVDTFDRHVRPHVPARLIGGVRLWVVEELRVWLVREAARSYAHGDNEIGGATAVTAPRRGTRRCSPDA